MLEPTNEQGVIVLFAQGVKEVGIEIINIQVQYPDATIRFNGVDYDIEFEYRASNFITHGHDVRDCDIIICWKNDLSDFILPIIELSNPDWKRNINFNTPSQLEKIAAYWKSRALKAESALEESSLNANGNVGRPRSEIDVTTLARIIADNPSVRAGMREFDISQHVYIRYREFAFQLMEKLQELGVSL